VKSISRVARRREDLAERIRSRKIEAPFGSVCPREMPLLIQNSNKGPEYKSQEISLPELGARGNRNKTDRWGFRGFRPSESLFSRHYFNCPTNSHPLEASFARLRIPFNDFVPLGRDIRFRFTFFPRSSRLRPPSPSNHLAPPRSSLSERILSRVAGERYCSGKCELKTRGY